tara:strand:- start:71 stop:655 length:585 start_codon:yes stop_codon:yes gene_type:complete
MQKGGKVDYDHEKKKWYGTHSASRYEAYALNLLGLKPTKTGVTSMNSAMYKRITSNNRNYNSTLYKLYTKLKPEKKIEVFKSLEEASIERKKENKKFEKKSNKPNDIGHLSYPEFINNALTQIQFEPNTLISPSRRQSQNYPPNVVRQRDYSQNYSRTDKRRRQLTYSGKEIAGNKFKKTKRRKKRKNNKKSNK